MGNPACEPMKEQGETSISFLTGTAMKREEVLQKLAASTPTIRQHGVKSLAVFGSMARGEATAGSDIDILVEFEEGWQVGLFEFVRLQRFLSELLGQPIDLATPDALREDMRAQILKEAVRAA
jgi:uncharacterized protein